jgi:hypothetical protein
LDGDKGDLRTEYVKRTHAVIADFGPLGIEVIYWSCPEIAERRRQEPAAAS